MTRAPVFINCVATMDDLLFELQKIEAAPITRLKSITAVFNKEGVVSGTIAELATQKRLKSIAVVVPDPPGTPTKPGDTLVCKGSACINGGELKIAVYREGG